MVCESSGVMLRSWYLTPGAAVALVTEVAVEVVAELAAQLAAKLAAEGAEWTELSKWGEAEWMPESRVLGTLALCSDPNRAML